MGFHEVLDTAVQALTCLNLTVSTIAAIIEMKKDKEDKEEDR